jgi:hypothetical protein
LYSENWHDAQLPLVVVEVLAAGVGLVGVVGLDAVVGLERVVDLEVDGDLNIVVYM